MARGKRSITLSERKYGCNRVLLYFFSLSGTGSRAIDFGTLSLARSYHGFVSLRWRTSFVEQIG
jgi:hypothetical protein